MRTRRASVASAKKLHRPKGDTLRFLSVFSFVLAVFLSFAAYSESASALGALRTNEDGAAGNQSETPTPAPQEAGAEGTQETEAPQETPQARRGILPGTEYSYDTCKEKTKKSDYYVKSEFQALFRDNEEEALNYLGCAIKTGDVKMFMVPYFIKSLINLLLGIAGLICILFLVIGGYQMVSGGLTEGMEKGKKTLTYAIIGLIVTLAAWIIVNIVQVAVTG